MGHFETIDYGSFFSSSLASETKPPHLKIDSQQSSNCSKTETKFDATKKKANVHRPAKMDARSRARLRARPNPHIEQNRLWVILKL